MFLGQRDKAKHIGSGNLLNSDSPVRTSSHDRRRNGVMAARLHGITIWSCTGKQLVNENPRATSLVAIDHSQLVVSRDNLPRLLKITSGQPGIICLEQDPLLPQVSRDQLQRFIQEGSIVCV